MKTILFLILIFSISSPVYSQSELVNQFDSSGKKDGKWIVYLDKDWAAINDSTFAVSTRYTLYDHGSNIYPMGKCGGKNYVLKHADSSSTLNKFLDGEYKWLDANGNLSSVHVFKNGEYVSCKEYFQSGNLSQHFDYTKKGDGQENGWTLYNYDKKGNIKYTYVFTKDENGQWPRTR
jgi:hypothetical protein